jgi:hypothetical protein
MTDINPNGNFFQNVNITLKLIVIRNKSNKLNKSL